MVQATKCAQEQNLGRYKGVLRADLASGGGGKQRAHRMNKQTKEQECMPFSPMVLSTLSSSSLIIKLRGTKDEKNHL